MAYKQNRNPFSNIGNPQIRRENLEGSTKGEANLDGSISIDESVEPGSPLEKRVIKHENQHLKDINSGKLSYTDDHVLWDGKKYPRKNGMIKYNGEWCPEGSHKLPWEKEAKRKE